MFRPTKRRGIAAITALTATSAIAILAGCAPASTERRPARRTTEPS